MSVQFGRWNLNGQAPAPDYSERVSASLAAYGPDSNDWYSAPGIKILYRAFHTTKESRSERQPHISLSGVVITWDGRLDNRNDLIAELGPAVSPRDTDVTIVAAGFDKWSTGCFGKLIGDWTLSIWNPVRHSLILARDPIGTRHLYYYYDDKEITWCSVIDPLVLFADHTFRLCEEYLAGWLARYPAVDLTPYVGLNSVASSSCVLLGPRKHIVAKYWDFDSGKQIRYRADQEYEEHFRSIFFRAVERRLRSDAPILAELSGGRDSSAIVCVGDVLMKRGEAEAPRLDTISCYDDSEPNWNERPYFSLIENRRGRTGWHINAAGADSAEHAVFSSDPPISVSFLPRIVTDQRFQRQIEHCVASYGNRVVLSGFAGDEVMGGSPSPTPEHQDLLATAQLNALAHQLKTWALQLRKPWTFLLWNAVSGFLPPLFTLPATNTGLLAWLSPAFAQRNRRALLGYPTRLKLHGPLPSFQVSLQMLNCLRRQLSCNFPEHRPPLERRYPYLDRDLLEFMFAIPREQLVRPTQRRSLMRRALAEIVPDEILNRRKGFVARSLLKRISTNWTDVVEMTHDLQSASLGIVDSQKFLFALEQARIGEEVAIVKLMRTISLERWLKDVRNLGIADLQTFAQQERPLGASVFRAEDGASA